MTLSTVRIKLKRASQFTPGLLPSKFIRQSRAIARMCLRKIRIDLERTLRRGDSFRHCFSRRKVPVRRHYEIRISDPDMCKGKLRVKVDRLLEEIDSPFKTVLGSLVPMM